MCTSLSASLSINKPVFCFFFFLNQLQVSTNLSKLNKYNIRFVLFFNKMELTGSSVPGSMTEGDKSAGKAGSRGDEKATRFQDDKSAIMKTDE